MDSSINYLLWIIIIVFVSFGYDFYKKKNFSKTKIFLAVLIPTWIIVGIVNSLFTNSFNNLASIFYKIIQTLPMIILFGGGTFIYKSYKSKKTIK
jgi:hypothetical protein